MTVVITGGLGFLGQLLAERIVADARLALPDGTELIRPKVVLADRVATEPMPSLRGKVTVRALDVTDAASVASVLDDAQAVFHLAAVVSGQAEAELALGLAVNLDGTRNVLDALAAHPHRVPVVGTSSLAVFGSNVTEPLTEAAPTQPRNSYGAAKAMSEILMSDYRRRGLVEARTLRLPTIIVRPGVANAAASSFASAMFREPLAGKPAVCPVDPGIAMWLASPQTAVDAMVQAMRVRTEDWPEFSAVNVPGVSATVAEMLEALAAVGGSKARDLVRLDPDPRIEAIVATWPARFDTGLAHELGFRKASPVVEIVRDYARRMK